MGICMHACYVHHIHAWSWQRLEEGVVTPGTGFDGYESLLGTKLRSSARAVTAFTHWTIYPAPPP